MRASGTEIPALAGIAEAAPASRRIGISYRRPRMGPRLQFRNFAGFEWNHVDLSLPDLPDALDGIRMIHLTDLHLRRTWPGELSEVIERINANPPDMMLYTGDFVDDKRDHRPALPLVERLVKSIRTKSGTFAVVGNHDGDLLAPHLIAWGVRVLVHQRAMVAINGRNVELIGLPGPDRIDLDDRFIQSMPPRRLDMPRIVLCHYPDLIRLARPLAADLYFAGHTHGGQICLPSERALLTHDTLPRSQCKGAHDIDGTCLVVNRGFGFTTMPVRINCPAEVIEVTLKKMHDPA